MPIAITNHREVSSIIFCAQGECGNTEPDGDTWVSDSHSAAVGCGPRMSPREVSPHKELPVCVSPATFSMGLFVRVFFIALKVIILEMLNVL